MPTPFSARKLLRIVLVLAVVLSLLGAAAAYLVVRQLERGLPSVAALRDLQLSVPLRVLSRDGVLIGEFGAERRAVLSYPEFPPLLVQAFLAAEDERFFEHGGVDMQGLLRAALRFLRTGEKSQGGSTITMQLARNVFLSSEKTFTRKFREILLSFKIERELRKEEILELYLNKIFLGERAYGVGAAALVYFDKLPQELSLSEMAVIAGLPKAPSRDNPVASPERARERRDYVLRRMRDSGHIQPLDYETALAEPVTVHPYRPRVEVDAHYLAEMVRADLYERYGEQAYTQGYTVTTTLDSRKQAAAVAALRQGLLDYDQRQGWRGAEARLPAELLSEQGEGEVRQALAALPSLPGLEPAAVVSFAPERLRVLYAGGLLDLGPEAYAWIPEPGPDLLKRGDIVRLRAQGAGWQLVQAPLAQAAMVALDPRDGAIQALVGGYDFFTGKFNRATQARRQAGSGFKPFLYAAGLAYGFTPASVILDAPVVLDDVALESAWRPQNYSGKFYGPTRLREALVASRNLVSIRLLQAIGIGYARDYIPRFGLPQDRLPRDLTMALGSAVYTPLEIARGYAALANGGFVVDPYFIAEIRDADGQVLFTAEPVRACTDCAEARVVEAARTDGTTPAASAPAVDPAIVWLVSDMLRDVTQRGTAAQVRELGRSDLSGKTGTTNEETDAWFAGYQKTEVAVAWVGFDQPQPLGRGEVGGRAALPIWMDYMRVALKGVPQEILPRPTGLVSVRINPLNGKLAAAGDSRAMFEVVQQSRIPEPDEDAPADEQPPPELEDLF
jgi:penicillin-binding protein 1A